MKAINTIHDALAYQLQTLLFAESKINSEMLVWNKSVEFIALREEIEKYAKSKDDHILKLERIFSYLMQEAVARKNQVILKLVDETNLLLNCTEIPHLKDILFLNSLQNIISYKISSYKSAYLFSTELELDTPSDLIEQILEWEMKTCHALSEISISEFNRLQSWKK